MRLRVNFITGVEGQQALGTERVQNMVVTLADQYSVDFVPIALWWPYQKLNLPLFYSYLPIKVWLLTRNVAINHIAHNQYAHLLNWLPLRRTVVTCYDLLELNQMEAKQVSYGWHWRQHFRLAAEGMRRADRVIAISEYTKRSILERFPDLADRIVVIYTGVDSDRYFPHAPDPNTLDKYGVSQAHIYVLYVGSEQGRKNLRTLVDAFALIRQDIPNLKLLKVGPPQDPAGRAALLHQVRSLGLENQFQLIDFVDEADLPHIYNAAAVFVFPSLREGFGLPPLEAMACGVPVISSNATSLPEVVGDAALLVDPRDATEMARLLRGVLSDRELARTLSHRGRERAQRFTFKSAAAKVFQVYEELWSTTERDADE